MLVGCSVKVLRFRVFLSTIKLLRVNLSEGLIGLWLIGDLLGLNLSIKDRHETPLVGCY